MKKLQIQLSPRGQRPNNRLLEKKNSSEGMIPAELLFLIIIQDIQALPEKNAACDSGHIDNT